VVIYVSLYRPSYTVSVKKNILLINNDLCFLVLLLLISFSNPYHAADIY